MEILDGRTGVWSSRMVAALRASVERQVERSLGAPAMWLDGARETLGRAVRGLVGAPSDPAEIRFDAADAGDPGWFGPDTVTWRVHSDLSSFVGGLRALIVQSMHPSVMLGFAEHSEYRDDPLGRLARTADFIAATTFGPTHEAEAAVARVRRVHQRVRGVTADGRAYSAGDPDLVAWVHNVEVESLLLAYCRYGPGLSAGDADTYVDEMRRVARRLGASDVDLPTTADHLHEWVGRHPDLRATQAARDAVGFLVRLPVPWRLRPVYGALVAAAVELVPVRWRVALRLPWVPLVDPLVVRPSVRALVAGVGWAIGPSPARLAAQARSTAQPSV